MRAVYWKELRELAAVWIILLVWAVIFAIDWAGWHAVFDKILSVAAVGGIVTGAVHGLLDRYRRDDLFLAHRPLSPLRFQLARTLVGVTVWLLPALVFLLLFRVAAPSPVENRFGRTIEPFLLSWSESLFLLGAMAACWALFRLVVGTRRPPAVLVLVFVLPAVAFASLMRAPSLPSALGVSLVIALTCTMTTVLGLAGARQSVLRAGCLLLLAGAILLETLELLRFATTALVLDTYPQVAVTADGEIWFRRQPAWDAGITGARYCRSWFRHYRVDRAYVTVGPALRSYRPVRARAPWEERSRSTWPWYRNIERALNSLEERRRRVDFAPVLWMYGGGRFLCRERAGLTVLAGFGPDGYVSGPQSERGARFEEPRQVLHWDPDVYHCAAKGQLVILGLQELDRIPRESHDPVRVSVSTRSLATPAKHAWPEDLGEARLVLTDDSMLWVARAGDVLFRSAWLPDEESVLGWSALAMNMDARRFRERTCYTPGPVTALAVFSEVEPIHPVRGTTRVRVFRRDHPMLQSDIKVRPETGSEHAAVMLRGVVALPLPVPLAIASHFSTPPRTWGDLQAWTLRDPFLAGGTATGWLLASLVLACACAWWARKQARMRCATERAVRLWMAATFLLGPLGLVWMCVVVGRQALERVGGTRRAVDLEASPATAEPWPEPLPTGTEVHA